MSNRRSLDGAGHDHPAASERIGQPPRAYRLPPGRSVRRARDWRLYDQAGGRYVDFWQADGAAFLGHRPRGLGALAGAEIDRGLWGPHPTAWPGRLDRALERLAELAGGPLEVANGRGAAWRCGAPDGARWFPAADGETAGGNRDADGPRLVVLPAPGVSVAGVASSVELGAVTVALLTRSAQLLTDWLTGTESVQRRELAVSQPVPPGYRRLGPWMFRVAPAPSAEDWVALRARAAERGILLPPDGTTPIVVPGELTRVERARWKETVNDWPD